MYWVIQVSTINFCLSRYFCFELLGFLGSFHRSLAVPLSVIVDANFTALTEITKGYGNTLTERIWNRLRFLRRIFNRTKLFKKIDFGIGFFRSSFFLICNIFQTNSWDRRWNKGPTSFSMGFSRKLRNPTDFIVTIR